MNSLDYKVIGKKIRDRRKALDITQEQVAEYLDLDVNANVKQNFTSLGKHFFT